MLLSQFQGREDAPEARRQGLGRIFKEAWDLEVGDEKVEVILK